MFAIEKSNFISYHLLMTTILLAAGLSSRMGRNKLLLPFRGRTVIENTLSSVLEISERVIVVTGFERERIERLLSSYHVDFVYNPDYEKGQRGSSMRGIDAVDDDFAILPGDLPLIEKSDIAPLVNALESHSIVRPTYNSIPGHPVCFRKDNRDKLLSFGGTMKEYLKKEGFYSIPSSINTVYDTDTPKKYSDLLVYNGNLTILENNVN